MPDDRLDRLFWWDDGSRRDPLRMAAQVMVFGDLEDIREAGERFGNEILAKVLDHPPRGLFDKKSWCFWHKKLGRPYDMAPRNPASGATRLSSGFPGWVLYGGTALALRFDYAAWIRHRLNLSPSA